VEVLTLGGLVRYSVLFVMELSTRKVHVAGIICQPGEAWMKNMARYLTDRFDGFLRGKRYMILDRDPLFTKGFRDILRGSGVEPLRLPARSPNLNAYAERFVLSIKSECLDKVVPLGERHLRHAIREYVDHYHGERHHQGLASSIITPEEPRRVDGRLRRRQLVLPAATRSPGRAADLGSDGPSPASGGARRPLDSLGVPRDGTRVPSPINSDAHREMDRHGRHDHRRGPVPK